MEQDLEKQRQTYQICRLGFGLLSFALVLACLSTVVGLTGIFAGRGAVAWITETPFWRWSNAPIVWGSLVGAYLLWGRWSDTGWQRRAGLLVLMCMVDAVLWFLDHGDDLGLRLSEVGHEWLRMELGQALGWAEFALIASLSGDLMAHFGVEQAPEAGKATRSLAATGAVVSFIFFLEQTVWKAPGWPLHQRGLDSLEALLLFLGTHLIWTITLIQATALTIATTRHASRVLAEMDWEDQENDLLKPPSESHASLLSMHEDSLDGDVPGRPRRHSR